MATSYTFGSGLLASLNRDFALLSSSTHARRALRTWRRDDARFAGFSSLDEVVEAVQRLDLDASRDLCWALLARVDAGDDLAARTMLHVMMPGLHKEMSTWLSKAERSLRFEHGCDRFDGAEVLVASTVQAIAEHADREPKWPVLDVLRRAHKLTLRAVQQERRWRSLHRVTDSSVGNDLAERVFSESDDGDSTAAEDLAGLLRSVVASGGLTQRQSELVSITRVEGYAPDEVADRFGMTPSTFRRARHRAETRLMESIAAAA